MAEQIKTAVVDLNKSDGKPLVTFSPEFIRAFGESITLYDDTLDQLDALVHGKGFSDEYGICNSCYQMRYITPKDISTFINDLFKAISMRLIECNICDLEKFSVAMAKKFIKENTGVCVGRGNIFAKSTYEDPRVETLMDLLVATENTFFDRCVYSKFEMKKRAEDLKKDYETINGLHFGATMKAVVKSLPEIIKKAMQENASFVCCNCDAVMDSIETFILFSVGLNSCMLTQMIGYCEPMTTALRKEKHPSVTQESVSPKKYAPVYIILTAGKTPVVSQAIKAVTHSKWSHVSIAFDAGLHDMYSYAMAETETAKDGKGLRKESIANEVTKICDICVYGLYVPKKNVDAMKSSIDEKMKTDTKFDISLLIRKAFKDSPERDGDSAKNICTTFVNGLMKEFSKGITDKAVPAPQDFKDALDNDDAIKLYEGPAKFYDASAITMKMKEYSKENDTKPFNEYVTEFCLVKTNDTVIRSRIPFDFNMRNIVLQDCTSSFKDTKSALFYMLKNPRSPIYAMLIESATDKRIASDVECSPTIQMLEPYFRECMNGAPLGFEYDRAGFQTDVNWLDKIAYGNNFMDGNYRMDAMGNDTRHPILTTLDTLHKMYCGCHLKSNEDLANNILKIAGVMNTIINRQPWAGSNKELVKDILCVLGECFTRNVIKLYNNHCVMITYSDDMNDTMIPGYTYCESFVFDESELYQEAETQQGEKPAAPGVSFDQKAPNTVTKTAILGKLMTMIRQFGRWIQEKLGKIPALFDKVNGGKVIWVQKHSDLNTKIGNAIREGKFLPNLTNFPQYNIPLKDLTDRLNRMPTELEELKNLETIDDNAVKKFKAAIFPGPDSEKIAATEDVKQQAEMIKNYVLFGKINPDASETAYKGQMTDKMWTDMCADLVNSKRLIDDVIKPITQNLAKMTKICESKANKANSTQAKQNVTNESYVYQEDGENVQQQQAAPENDAQKLFDLVKGVTDVYQNTLINALTNTFFNTYYGIYKSIVDNFQSTKIKETGTNNAAAQTPANPANQNTATPQATPTT